MYDGKVPEARVVAASVDGSKEVALLVGLVAHGGRPPAEFVLVGGETGSKVDAVVVDGHVTERLSIDGADRGIVGDLIGHAL